MADPGLLTELRSTWWQAVGLIAKLDAIAPGSLDLLVKIDAERENGRIYTVLVRSTAQFHPVFRQDSYDLVALLRDALCVASERDGHAPTEACSPWFEWADVMSSLDAQARDRRLLVILRVDGISNGAALYDVVVSGAVFNGDSFQRTGDGVGSLLSSALAFCMAHH